LIRINVRKNDVVYELELYIHYSSSEPLLLFVKSFTVPVNLPLILSPRYLSQLCFDAFELQL